MNALLNRQLAWHDLESMLVLEAFRFVRKLAFSLVFRACCESNYALAVNSA